MWNHLWRKEVVFKYEKQLVVECVVFMSLVQSSTLSPFSYNFFNSQADRVLPVRCSMLQTEQSAFDGLNGFFRDIGLSISESKSEFVLLSRKDTNLCATKWSMHVCCAQISVHRCGVRRKASMRRTRALYSAEMLQTTKLFAIYGNS
jgi:hypothetical protein